MRIAFCHNHYQQAGGEDQVFRAESDLMEAHGHQVLRYTKHNDEINQLSKFKLMKKTFWNTEVLKELNEKFAEFRPDVVHFTNTFPLISPAAYRAARESGAAVVQSLHNFRLICPGSLLLRNEKSCEKCVGKFLAWPAIWHKCYRNSVLASAVTAGANSWHRFRGTWRRYVNRFIALTQFSRDKFIAGGLDPTRIAVKQNFATPAIETTGLKKNGRALFVGRLSREKGIDVVLESWKKLDQEIGLDIVGDGPWMSKVEQAVQQLKNVKLWGRLENEDVRRLMAQSTVQIVPSTAYETFGMVVIEAFSVATPAIVSNHGSLAELVDKGQTGFTFEPGNSDALVEQVRILVRDPQLATKLGENAKQEFETKYTGEANYPVLCGIYEDAIRESQNDR